jgi:hypothetical protein
MMNADTLEYIYFSTFQFLIKFGMIFGGKSSDGMKVLSLQKKVLEIWLVLKIL